MAKPDIKQLKPNSNGKFKQGYYVPNCPAKYKGKKEDEPIIYRSGLEYKFMRMCDLTPSILKWSSETLCIPYQFEGKQRRYFIDFIVETDKGEIWLVEIKPYSQVMPPNRFAADADKHLWMKNSAKWKAAIAYASKFSNMQFKIITERFFKQ